MSQRTSFLCALLLSVLIIGCENENDDVTEATFVLQSPLVRPIGFTEVQTESATIGEFTITYDIRGQSVVGTMTGTAEAVLEIEQVDSTKLEILIRVGTMENSIQRGVNRQDDSETNSLQGLLVVATLLEEQWSCAMKSGDPGPEQKKELAQMAVGLNAERYVYPEESVAVGDNWELSLPAIQLLSGSLESKPTRGSGTMEFREVIEFDGESCAHLFFDLEYNGSSRDDQGHKQLTAINMKGNIYRSLATLVDVSGKTNAQIRITQPIEDNGSMLMTGPASTTTRSVVK